MEKITKDRSLGSLQHYEGSRGGTSKGYWKEWGALHGHSVRRKSMRVSCPGMQEKCIREHQWSTMSNTDGRWSQHGDWELIMGFFKHWGSSWGMKMKNCLVDLLDCDHCILFLSKTHSSLWPLSQRQVAYLSKGGDYVFCNTPAYDPFV